MGPSYVPGGSTYPFGTTRRLENSRIALKQKKSASQMAFFGTKNTEGLINYWKVEIRTTCRFDRPLGGLIDLIDHWEVKTRTTEGLIER